MAAIYNRYQVHGALITSRLINQSGTESVKYVIYANTISSAPSAFLEASQRDYAIIRMIPVDQDKAFVKKYYSIKKVFGKNTKDDNFSALTNADPVNKVYLHRSICNTNETTTINVYEIFKITFYVKFFDLLP